MGSFHAPTTKGVIVTEEPLPQNLRPEILRTLILGRHRLRRYHLRRRIRRRRLRQLLRPCRIQHRRLIQPRPLASSSARIPAIAIVRRLGSMPQPDFIRRQATAATRRPQHQAGMVPRPVAIAEALAERPGQIVVANRRRMLGTKRSRQRQPNRPGSTSSGIDGTSARSSLQKGKPSSCIEQCQHPAPLRVPATARPLQPSEIHAAATDYVAASL